MLSTGLLTGAPEEGAAPAGDPIEITSDGENSVLAGIASAQDNVLVKYKGDVVYCDRLTYNTKTKVAVCKGNVRIYTGDKVYRGDTLIYNFETKSIQSADFRMAYFPAYVAGDSVFTPGLNHYHIENGFFTTDNREDPAFKMRARTVELYPDDSIVLKNIVVYAGSVPILWLPIYAQALDDDRAAYQWTAGFKSSFGAFFDNEYNWVYNSRLKGTVHIDMSEKRGFAGGVDMFYKKDDNNKAVFRSFYSQDNLYSDGPPRGSEAKYAYPDVNSDNRYRVSYKQNFLVGPDFSILADVNRWSDPYVTLDYFENEYQHEQQPDNFVQMVQYSPHYTISLLMRDQVNDFFETVERKPELKMSFQRQKLFDTPISYEGETSVTNFERTYSNTDTTSSNLQSYGAYRYDTYHQFLYPKQYFNWLNITPRLGLRGTYWSDDNSVIDDYSSDGYENKNPRGRFVPNLGVESSFKVSRVWSDVKNKDMGIDGIRHVAEPFVNMQYIPGVYGASPNDIRGFDDRLASTRLAPINFPDYNSIDSIDRQAVVRHGVRNKIQTQRDGKNYDLIDWAIYADLDIDQNFSGNNHPYSNIFNDIQFNPFPWLTFNSQSSSNLYDDTYSEYNNDITWQITRAYRVRFGNRYIHNSELFENSDLFTLNNFYRLNEHWQFETEHQFEASDGDLQEQAYTIHRDLSAWLMSATFKQRYVNDRQNELAIYLSLTLKAFPATELTTGLK